MRGSDGNIKTWRKDRLDTVQLAFQSYEEQANAAYTEDDYEAIEMLIAPEGMNIDSIEGAEN